MDRALRFTSRGLFPADTLLNVALGLALLLAPGHWARLLTLQPALPAWLYRGLGIGFLAFALWQAQALRKGLLRPADLTFASVLAIGPVIALSAALLSPVFALQPLARGLLWIGNAYMLGLGSLYAWLALRYPTSQGAEPHDGQEA